MPDEDDDDMLGNEPATVPYHRFREVAQKRRALNAELDKLRAEYATAAGAAKELEAVREAGGIGASRRIAPNTNSSDPSKLALSEILSVERPVTTVASAAAGRARQRRSARSLSIRGW
mgnify:CR=1 FL=1